MRNAMDRGGRVVQPSEGIRESRVQQAPAADADINAIVNKHMKAAGSTKYVPPPPNPYATRKPMFMDVPAMSLHDMMNTVAKVQSNFNLLPSKLRQRFNNSPVAFMSYIQDPENRESCLIEGLIPPETDKDWDILKKHARGKKKAAIIEQLDIQREAEKEAGLAPGKPDEEAQPNYKPPIKGGEKA